MIHLSLIETAPADADAAGRLNLPERPAAGRPAPVTGEIYASETTTYMVVTPGPRRPLDGECGAWVIVFSHAGKPVRTGFCTAEDIRAMHRLGRVTNLPAALQVEWAS